MGAPSITFIGDENTGLFRKSGGSVGFVSDATEIANFDSNGITISSGNIIIPDSIIHSGDTDTKIRFPSANVISFETAGVEKISMGTGEVTFNDTGADVDFRIEGDTNANLFKVDAGNDRIGIGIAAPTRILQIKSAGVNATQIGLVDANSTNEVFRVGQQSDGDGFLQVLTDSGTVGSQLEASGDTFFNGGNVGIGTTSPGRQLEVNSNSANTFIRIKSSDTGNAGFEFGDQSDTVQGAIFLNSSDNSLRFNGFNNSERMRIDSSGNVGIGTSSPSVTLDIEAVTPTIRLTDSDASGTPECEIRGGGGDLVFSADRDNEKASTLMQFQTDGSTAMTINSSQRVGIGTTSPASELHVMDGDLFLTDNSTATNSGQAVYFQSTTNGWAKGSAHCVIHGLRGANSSGIIRFDTRRDSATNERMRINENGQLLIGTTTQSNTNGTRMEIFQTDTTAYSATSNRVHGLVITNDSDTDGGFAGIELRASDGDGFVGSSLLKTIADGTNYSNDFVIQTRHGGNYRESLRINSSGEIGINTATPLTQLDVRKDDPGNGQLLALGSNGTSTTDTAFGLSNALVLFRNRKEVLPNQTTDLVSGYGGSLVLITILFSTGDNVQQTRLITHGWNSFTQIFSNSYGTVSPSITFSTASGVLKVNHSHNGNLIFNCAGFIISGPHTG